MHRAVQRPAAMTSSYKTNFENSKIIPHTRITSQSQITDNYEIGEKIGQGSFGKVYAVKEKATDVKWAMKCINKLEKSIAIKLLEREVAILKKVKHEHIIKLKEVFETHEKVYLIMEYCEGGELAAELAKVKKFSEAETKNIMSALASAIAYLHKCDIVHRDLKLSNILLSNNPLNSNDHLFIKVTDFGLSVIKGGVGHENMLKSFCGTLIYMAPEIIENKTYSQQCDVWALGVIAYQLICGIPPFMSDDEDLLMAQIRSGEYKFFSPAWDNISSEAKNCIEKMLHLDTGYRLTAAEVLQQPWFTGIKDTLQTSNVLEMMSSWKDDLLKDHLKEEMENDEDAEAQAGGSHTNRDENEEVDEKPKSIEKEKIKKEVRQKTPPPPALSSQVASVSSPSTSSSKKNSSKSSTSKSSKKTGKNIIPKEANEKKIIL